MKGIANLIHEKTRLELEINYVGSSRHILQTCLAFVYKEINLCYNLAWNNKAIKFLFNSRIILLCRA